MTPIVDSSRQVIQALYSDHHHWLKSWLRRKLGCAEQAADFAHDTFVKLIGKWRDSFDDEPRALLRHVANGLVIDYWRRQEVERAYLESVAHLSEAETPSMEAHHLIVESLLKIEAMLRDLPPLTREIFLLAQLDGFTHLQIAQQKNVCVNTVRRHIHKALVACLTAAF